MRNTLTSFVLKVNQPYKYKDKCGNTHTVTLTIHKNHNHEEKPLFCYNYPLKKGICKANDFIVTVETDNSNVYDSPYTEILNKLLCIYRECIIFRFEVKFENQERAVECTILPNEISKE